jgi:coenzyme F420-reducing hydrogenase alpha subunit
MAYYVEFETEDGGTILVEVVEIESEEEAEAGGLVKAGRRDDLEKKAKEIIEKADRTFEDGLEVVRYNANAFIKKLKSGLVDPPDEVEITFGLKATGKVGNFAIAEAGVEANYAVKLTWKREEKKAKPHRTTGWRLARRPL